MYTTSEVSSLHTPERVHQALGDQRRLNSLKAMAMMDSPGEAIFDRLTRLASRLVGAPISLVALLDQDRAFFKSAFGLPPETRVMPLNYSVCKHVVVGHQPLIVRDAREVDFLHLNSAVTEMGLVGYLGIPLMTSDGQALGSFCVIDTVVREWTQVDVEILQDLAQTTMTLMEMRAQIFTQTTQSDSKMRGLMTQMVQAETKRKEIVVTHGETVSRLTQLLESHAPANDILTFLNSKITT